MADRGRWWAWLGLSAGVIAADQLAKMAVIAALQPGEQRVITEFFSFVLTFNTGAAFSFMRDVPGWPRYLFSVVALAAAIVIVWLLRRGGDRWYCAGLALILGGALGNLWDRVALGHVVDFLLFHWRDWNYPAFNIADSAITIGAAMLILDSIGRRRDSAAASD
ncbi:MAG TPA: signal peptidase II [Casimicrobiaceae bacterium]|jgi:signal peptidase II|nr:signal peptidase II [Casimicrobiaceae bacterium]